MTPSAHGHRFKLGRRKPPALGPHLKARNYLSLASLPTPPPSDDYSAKAAPVLSDIYGNDVLGDCVIAGGYHIVGVETGNATGSPFRATPDQIIADYGAIGGYKRDDPSTDNGCDEVTALNYWMSPGFTNGTRLLGWLTVDATNKELVQACMWLFENLFFGIALPDKWISPFPSGNDFVWDVAGEPNYENGHCVVGVGYSTSGVRIATWGLLGTMTYEAIAKYAVDSAGGQLYCMLSPDQVAKGMKKAPNDVDWDTLVSDFNTLGGHVQPPSPPPPTPPAPPPLPPGSVSLADAQAWAEKGIRGGRRHGVELTSEHAITLAKRGLAQNWPPDAAK